MLAPGWERGQRVLVGLSGGADSLALAAAVAAEARRFEAARGTQIAGALIVDHGLQPGSEAVAQRAAQTARELGLSPVIVQRVTVDSGTDGPEAAARAARYEAFAEAAEEAGADIVVTAHTRDDQAEQVLLALARGSGLRSLAGIPLERNLRGAITVMRPFLVEHPEITRATTLQACHEARLEPWHDPHNSDPAFTRVRVRHGVLPRLEEELGGGVTAALARSADLAREDADALDALADAAYRSVLAGAAGGAGSIAGEGSRTVAPVAALAELPAAVLNRVIRQIAATRFASHLGREHTLAVAALVTQWRGQGPIFVPGMRVTRQAGVLVFEEQHGSPRIARD